MPYARFLRRSEHPPNLPSETLQRAATDTVSSSSPESARGTELELDVVGIAEDQDRDAKRFAEVTDFAVRYAARVQHPGGILEHLARHHSEAHVVEPHAVLAETVTCDGERRIGEGADSEAHRAVAEEGAGIE